MANKPIVVSQEGSLEMETLRYYFAGSYPIRILLGSLVCAIVADGAITNYLILNGYAVEGNPLPAFLG